jgi:hypothetical protein
MRKPALLLLALAAIFSMGAASGPPQWLVEHVRDEINDGYDAGEPEGPPLRQPSPRMFKKVDINGDGIADWKVDFSGKAGWCGTGGCRMELWLGKPDGGVTPVWDEGVREFKLRPRKTGAVVDVDFHGSVCGGAGVMACPRRYVWDAAEAAFVEAVNAKGNGFLAGLPVNALESTIDDAPASVRAQAQRLIAACLAVGGKLSLEGIGAGRIPDLNGDGRREWYIGGEYGDCSTETEPANEPLRLIVMVSTPDGGFAPAWETSEAFIGFDISTAPAVMVQLDDDSDACAAGFSVTCPRNPFKWDEASRKLVLAD